MIPDFGTQEHKRNIHKVVSFDYDPRSRTNAVARWRCGAFSDRALPVDDLDIGIRLCLACFDPELFEYQKKLRAIAHAAVTKARAEGSLHPAMFCDGCGCSNGLSVSSGRPWLQAHHDDYGKPLSVRWLCSCCHVRWHRENEPIYPPLVREVAA